MLNNLTDREINDIIQWDVKNWSYALNFWIENATICKGSKVLALGEREGGLSLFFAKIGCQVICSDYNKLPLSTHEMHKNYEVVKNIEYKSLDMRNTNLKSNSLDVVVFKSVIGALGNKSDQLKSLNEIYRILKPGGYLLIAENLEGSFLHRFLRGRYVKWGKRWAYVTKKDVLKWTECFSNQKVKTKGVTALFGRNENQRRVLGSIDKFLVFFVPKKWRYILFGVFVK